MSRNIVAYMLLAFLFAGSVSGCGQANGADDDKKSEVAAQDTTSAAPARAARKEVLVEVENVAPRALRDILTLPGQTEALHDVTLSSERAGRVEWIGPTEGDQVKKGEVLVKIDLAVLSAALDRAQAEYDLAMATVKRRRTLFADRVLSQEELDQAETEVLKTESVMRTAKVEYEQGIVRSPIGGSVEDVIVDPGEYVKQGDPVISLVNIETLRINVNVPEMDVRYIKKGDKTRVTVDAYPEERWTGEIDFVAHKADPATKTFKARIVVDNADKRIRPGMIARVRFLRRLIPDALTAPLFAVLDRGGEQMVYVVEDGIAKARQVELGVIDRDRIQILKGLEIGDALIIAGQNQVEEGMAVTTK